MIGRGYVQSNRVISTALVDALAPRLLWLIAAATLLISGRAFAFGLIVVDGSDSDWTLTQSCFTKPVGVNPSPIQLNRACVENNNTLLNTGSLFTLYESPSAFPTGVDTYFGFLYDVDKDGVITDNDRAFALFFPAGSGGTPASLNVYTAVSFSLVNSYSNPGDCGGPAGQNGWSGARSGTVVEMGVAYGCLGLAFNDDNRLFRMGAYPNFDLTYLARYNGTSGTLIAQTPPNDVSLLVSVSGANRNFLSWTNPTLPNLHEGVLILRSTGAPPNAAPISGTAYLVGQSLGNASVIYLDRGQSGVNTFTDVGLTNGTRYYYKVYNHIGLNSFATGNVPSSSGVFSEPTTRSSPSPMWCYSVGYPSLQQPSTDLGVGIFTASNLGAVTANLTTINNPLTDGGERWRPAQLSGAVQVRSPIVPLFNRSGKYILTGDQAGFAYVIDSQTGSTLWTGNGGTALGDRIQAPLGVQLNQYANAAFKTAHPNRDLVFVATRNNSATNNKVFALSSVDGSVVWTYAPNNLDIVSGGMFVDYANNRLWVGARSNGGLQSSLRVLDTLTGTQLAALSLGDLDMGVNVDFVTSQVYLANNAGTVYGVSLSAMSTVWSSLIGSLSSYPFPTGGGFIASFKSGSVASYSIGGTTLTQNWSTPIATPTGVTANYATNKLYVGSSDGKLHQLNGTTGVDEKQVLVSDQNIGMPTFDSTAQRLHVGTLDGRICAFQLPIP
jgi:hypothetical protein